ncbi:MAG TPA: hypothetical protein VGT03_12615 [Candidatus Acidoferrales bacterium]|nr:hypothetical protein [Candidatus Acidoferrales bacterium]
MVAIASLPLRAYVQPLDSESIREAYFLGQRRDEVARTFLSHYVQSFPIPRTGPHIGRVEILTPYYQVVLGSEEGTLGGTVIDAEQEYHSHPALFLVHVWIYSTPTFTPGAKWDEFWEELIVRVGQRKPLRPLKSSYIKHGFRGPGGTEFELQFDAAQITSAPLTIDVSGPGAEPVAAKFDLSKLK